MNKPAEMKKIEDNLGNSLLVIELGAMREKDDNNKVVIPKEERAEITRISQALRTYGISTISYFK